MLGQRYDCRKIRIRRGPFKRLCFQITVQGDGNVRSKEQDRGWKTILLLCQMLLQVESCFKDALQETVDTLLFLELVCQVQSCLHVRVAVKCHNDCGPHHRYSVGQLYDNIDTAKLSVQNRRHSEPDTDGRVIVLYFGCKIREKMRETPKSEMNFAANVRVKLLCVWKPVEPLGFVHAFRKLNIKTNTTASCCPESLYLSQLEARLEPKHWKLQHNERARKTSWTVLRNRFKEEEEEVQVVLTPRAGSSVMYDIKQQIDPKSRHSVVCL